ncbi:hypothetical protein VP01_538g1 [Puccinia sorghi]|uniref:Uncharacterized protein n=1 Tax=Puccinia sorghi TaxID=27349 RepID=A0A0L6UJX6_9BASI|nr:hypothetical protein VP01_538g1 [Puccinia sorghi]
MYFRPTSQKLPTDIKLLHSQPQLQSSRNPTCYLHSLHSRTPPPLIPPPRKTSLIQLTLIPLDPQSPAPKPQTSWLHSQIQFLPCRTLRKDSPPMLNQAPKTLMTASPLLPARLYFLHPEKINTFRMHHAIRSSYLRYAAAALPINIPHLKECFFVKRWGQTGKYLPVLNDVVFEKIIILQSNGPVTITRLASANFSFSAWSTSTSCSKWCLISRYPRFIEECKMKPINDMMSFLGVSACARTFQSHIQNSTCDPGTCFKPGNLFLHIQNSTCDPGTCFKPGNLFLLLCCVSYLKPLLAAETFHHNLPHPILLALFPLRTLISFSSSHNYIFILPYPCYHYCLVNALIYSQYLCHVLLEFWRSNSRLHIGSRHTNLRKFALKQKYSYPNKQGDVAVFGKNLRYKGSPFEGFSKIWLHLLVLFCINIYFLKQIFSDWCANSQNGGVNWSANSKNGCLRGSEMTLRKLCLKLLPFWSHSFVFSDYPECCLLASDPIIFVVSKSQFSSIQEINQPTYYHLFLHSVITSCSHGYGKKMEMNLLYSRRKIDAKQEKQIGNIDYWPNFLLNFRAAGLDVDNERDEEF